VTGNILGVLAMFIFWERRKIYIPTHWRNEGSSGANEHIFKGDLRCNIKKNSYKNEMIIKI
jgi:hypothetical protein